jgi:hypothetical protein
MADGASTAETLNFRRWVTHHGGKERQMVWGTSLKTCLDTPGGQAINFTAAAGHSSEPGAAALASFTFALISG